MSPRHRPQRPLREVRPLGARVTFVENEWLPSLLRRVGHAFGASTDDITHWCGLYNFPIYVRTRLGNRLWTAPSQGVETGLGLTAAQLQTTVMDHLPVDLVSLRPDGTPMQSKDWSRGTGTRYCVQCLREQPGVFYTQWRLWWSFICDRHHILLRSGCGACHQDIVEATAQEPHSRDPALCWATLPDGDSCRHPLAETWDEDPLNMTSPMLHAQLILAREWASSPPPLPDVPARTLRGAGIALLGAGQLDQIADLAGVPAEELRGLFDQTDRTGGTPPKEPLAMAALVGAAYRLITDPERKVRGAIRETTFNRPVRSAEAVTGPGSGRYLLNFWPGIDARMRGRVLRAIDPDLPPIQRLVHGSAASAEAFEATLPRQKSGPLDGELWRRELDDLMREARTNESTWRWSERMVPRLMWPSWAAPLGIDDKTDAVTLQIALADALRIAGTGEAPDVEAIAGIGRRLRPSLLGTPKQTDDILRQICELALLLRAKPGPIDYERRLGIPTDQLIVHDQWQALTESVGELPGRERRLLNARRYAFMRMSATAPRDLPDALRFRTGSPDAADYTEFIVTMTAELKTAIDMYLIGWLDRFEYLSALGERPPAAPKVVAHEPPRFVHPNAHLAPELDDIDVPGLHELVGNGVIRLGALGVALDRTPRHVRWAIAAHPVPTGRPVNPIDWRAEMSNLPDHHPMWRPPAFPPPPAEHLAFMARLDL